MKNKIESFLFFTVYPKLLNINYVLARFLLIQYAIFLINRVISKTSCFPRCVILQVSLGKCNELLAADYTADKLPADCQSVKGLGRVAPDAEDSYTL